MFDRIPCMWMRGGTSKGAYFIEDDLPRLPDERDALLLRIMGSPDIRQIDGIGGADPLTSKVAIVRPSQRPGIDIDYLFLQVFVDQPLVSDAQNCGNILAGVGPFALERGLIQGQDGNTNVSIYMENTGQVAIQNIQTPNGQVCYHGDTHIDGVPIPASPVYITFQDTAGSSCGSLLPTGHTTDKIDSINVTCIDNGMPVVILSAADFGLSGNETRKELENNQSLRNKLESIRLKAGRMMNLGDVSEKSVPKLTLISSAQHGGTISTRTFIPHRCHASIGVLGAVSVASACLLENSPAARIAWSPSGTPKRISIEHPSGETSVVIDVDHDNSIRNAAIIRTTRKLFDGYVFS
ncbi:MAG: (4E)-oxalomesaconate Delta-isomerase [Candidatus Celerinatantimonas neptuna]|nr:MAG: (4E)-oxalomesaconate Delta-isomerase [Candidatus Celerinatantimonas neptuna]